MFQLAGIQFDSLFNALFVVEHFTLIIKKQENV